MRSAFAGLAAGGLLLVMGAAAGLAIDTTAELITAAAVGVVFLLIGMVGLLANPVRGGPA